MPTRSKGDAVFAAAAVKQPVSVRRPTLLVSAGLEHGLSVTMGVVPIVRTERRMPSGWSVAVITGTRARDSQRETPSYLVAGYRLGWLHGRLGVWAGVEVGGGLVVTTDGERSASYTPVELIAPRAGLSQRIGGNIALAIEGAVSTVMANDSTITLVPAAWLGVLVDL